MSRKIWEGIVKCQRSLFTTHEKPTFLVYPQSRAFMLQAELTPELAKLFKEDEAKIFVHAWAGEEGDLHYTERAPWQDW